MINGLVDALKSTNRTTHNNSIAINSLNYARNFLLTLTEIDHRLNQSCSGLQKLDSDASTIYNYVGSLSNKGVIPTLIHLVDLRPILNNILKAIPTYLPLPNNQQES